MPHVQKPTSPPPGEPSSPPPDRMDGIIREPVVSHGKRGAMSRIVYYVVNAQQASAVLREGVILARPAINLTEAEPPLDSRRLPMHLYHRLRPRIHQMLKYDGSRSVFFEFHSDDVWAVKDSCGPGCAHWVTVQNIFLFAVAYGSRGKDNLRALFL